MKNLFIAFFLIINVNIAFANGLESMDMDTISVDGQFDKKPLTRAERLKLLRQKLEKKNELMVKKKIELIRYQQEAEMYKKMEAAMNKMMTNLNNI